MSLQLPFPAQGIDVGNVVLTPQTVSNTGTLADTTPTMALAGRWKNLRIRSRNTLEESGASDQGLRNNIILDRGTAFEVDAFFPKALVSASDFVGGMYSSVDYWKWAQQVGNQGSNLNKLFTGYGISESCEVVAEGKTTVMVHMVFEAVGVTVGNTGANPSVVTA